MYKYDVALSFSGEDREYVRIIAKKLKNLGIEVFFDEFEKANLWGKDLYQYLQYVYKEAALYCVIFISENYMKKVWTSHELKSAQDRALYESREYILPLIINKSFVPGLLNTIGYIDTSIYTEDEIAKMIKEKIELIKPTKEKETEKKIFLYNFIYEIIDFIVDSYCLFGIGSKVGEIGLMSVVIHEYKEFLLNYAHEISREVFIFIVKTLELVTNYIESNEMINFYHAANLRYKTDALGKLIEGFRMNGFKDEFDLFYFAVSDQELSDKEGLLKTAIENICNKIICFQNKPRTTKDYILLIEKIRLFEDYSSGELSEEEILLRISESEEVEEIQNMLDEEEAIS